jgi:hypothetical protein
LTALDARFSLTPSVNPEIAVAWVQLALASGDTRVLPRLEQLVGTYGRMKYLRPLYSALVSRDEFKPLAAQLFARFKQRYHPIAQSVVARLLDA